MPEFDSLPEAARSLPAAPKRKGKGCLPAILAAIAAGTVLASAGLLLLNGPGFRALARFGGLKAAASQGLKGDFRVSGTLWSGFRLHGIRLSDGKEGGKEILVEELVLDYRAFDLLRSPSRFDWLDSVRLGPARVRWELPDAPARPEGPENEKPPPAGPDRPPGPSPLWNLLDAEFEIADLTLSLQQGDRVWSVDSLRLGLPGRGGEGSLRVARLALPGQAPLEGVDAVLRPAGRSLEIGPLSLLGYAELESLAISQEESGDLGAVARLGVAGGRIDLTLQLPPGGPPDLSVSLARQSTLDLARLKLPLESQLHGSVSDLALRFAGNPAEPATWSLAGKVAASGTGWDGLGVDSLLVRLEGRKIEVEALKGRTNLRLDAETALDGVADIGEISRVSLFASLVVDCPDLAETAAAFGSDLPLAGSAKLEARDLQIREGRITSGGALLLAEGLSWKGAALSPAQVAVHVERAGFLRLAADAGLDEATRLHLVGTVDLEARRYDAETRVDLDASARLGEILATLGREGLLSGGASLEWKGAGPLGPGDHGGTVSTSLKALSVRGGVPIHGTIAARYAGKSASLDSLDLRAGEVRLQGGGSWDGTTLSLSGWKLIRDDRAPLTLSAAIPLAPGGAFFDQPGPVSLELAVADLATGDLTGFFSPAPPLEGMLDAKVNASGTLAELDLTGRLSFRPASAIAPGSPGPLASAEFELAGDADRPSSWSAALRAVVSGLSWNGMALENLAVEAATETETVGRPLLARLRFDQSGTLLEAAAHLDLGDAETLAALAAAPLQVDATLEVGDAGALVRDFAPPAWKGLPLAGSLSASVEKLRLERGSVAAGSASVRSGNFSFGGEPLAGLSLGATVPAPDQVEAVALVEVDESSRLEGKASYQLGPGRYEGQLRLDADLLSGDSRLRRILSGRPLADLLPGNTSLRWKGGGSLSAGDHHGDLAAEASSLRLAAGAEPLDLQVQGSYSADQADFPVLGFSGESLDFTGSARWKDHELTLLGSGRSGGREVLKLDARFPLDPAKLTPELWFGQEETLSVDLDLDALPVGRVSRLFLAKPPVTGDLSLDFAASGTASAPSLRADLSLENLAVPREGETLAAGRLAVNAAARDGRLTLAGEYRHPEVNPLRIEAAMPFQPGPWATGARAFSEESFTASAKMDSSPLGFLAGQVPGIESIAGQIALDAAVSGTFAAPELRGNGHLEVSRLRLENRLAPSLRDIDLFAHFGKNRIDLEKLSAVVAGGTLSGSGGAVFRPGGEPELRLSLQGREVLVFRSPEVNVRTDLDLTLAGPWSRAALSGELGLVNSRYYKNFDLLPVGLPTKRVESALPTVSRTPRGGGAAYRDLEIGVPLAPFRDWPLSVRLHTKDPFLVRSNLVESDVTADLRLTGTLGRPNPIGRVSIREGEMRLPFSRIDVETGRIEFDEATGFNGAIEFKARGKADRYQVAIYLYDRILSPQYVLTSIPPMPSEDIITLLATGTTRSELVGEDAGSVAATKAAGLFLKNLRQKSNEADADPTLLDLLEERTELELGRVNQETGQQTFGGKIRLWKQLFFVGDVDAGSDYRALLKYVFRLE